MGVKFRGLHSLKYSVSLWHASHSARHSLKIICEMYSKGRYRRFLSKYNPKYALPRLIYFFCKLANANLQLLAMLNGLTSC